MAPAAERFITSLDEGISIWPKRLVPHYDPKAEAQHTDLPRCMTCAHTYDPNCPDCHGAGEVMTPNQFVHHYLSAPVGEPNRFSGFVLPLVHLDVTRDPRWLANLIINARDMAGHPLCVEQLLEIFDNIQYWSQEVERHAPYWRVAALAIIKRINQQMMGGLPEGGGDGQHC